jgi:hypothetical protein
VSIDEGHQEEMGEPGIKRLKVFGPRPQFFWGLSSLSSGMGFTAMIAGRRESHKCSTKARAG